jgi:transposase InsO family protein
VAISIDHCSRRVMGFALFRGQPTAKRVREFMERAIRAAGRQPKYLVTDHGRQFVARNFRRWCRRRGIRQRFEPPRDLRRRFQLTPVDMTGVC